MTRYVSKHTQSVYDAESAVFEETMFEAVLAPAAVEQFAQMLFEHTWWKTQVGVVPEVVQARSDATRSVARSHRNRYEIRLAAHQTSYATLAHEAAHVASDVIWDSSTHHDARWRATMIDVTALCCGTRVAEALVRSFEGFKLDVAQRFWTAPTATHPQGLAGLHNLSLHARQTEKVDGRSDAGPIRSESGAIICGPVQPPLQQQDIQ